MDFDAIDWNAMWQEAAGRSHWNDTMSRAEHWDKRAATFDTSVNQKKHDTRDKNDYISNMLARIEIRPAWTVLDIGAGPGTLALPLAEKAASVTALDISGKMLARLREKADQKGLKNITCLHADWHDIVATETANVHDIVVASRSLMSADMKPVLSYVNSITRQAAYLTFPVVHLPFDWEIYRVIGRGQKKHPPYIYLYNMLFQMGIPANVEVLHSTVRMRFSSVQEAIDSLQWRTDPFTEAETAKIRAYLEPRFAALPKNEAFTHEGKSQWALIWWKKESNGSC